MVNESILVTSSSIKFSLIECIKNAASRINPKISIIAGDSDKSVPSRYLVDNFWHMPVLDKLSIKDIISECENKNIKTILPSRDEELIYWAKIKEELEFKNIFTIISPLRAIEICFDKLEFSFFCQKLNMPCIQTSIDINSLNTDLYVVKERFGSGSKKIVLKVTKKIAIKESLNFIEPIFQPYIEGSEISVDIWLTNKSKVYGLVLRKRNKVVNGESQITSTFRNLKLEIFFIKFIESFGLTGPVVLQAIFDDNDIHIIEVNARFGGASSASISMGLDMLYWSLFERYHPHKNLPKFKRNKKNITQIRITKDILVDDLNL